MEELPGRIGPYDVRDRLGQGGMGVVYLGFDPLLDRPVAIKVLRVPDEETRRRFLREARLAARVHHPNIVSIYAVGEHEGNPYLAMEFIAGRTMAQIIRGADQVPLARKVHWLSELCAGLGHAHRSGIVHRDVKPSNLLIAQGTGALRLVDFGIAHGHEASGMTMAGMIVGTPQYMSPEQIQGQPVDARSDIFSVGAVAYELITGRQAFGGDNLYHVSRQIVGEQPRAIESFVPDAPSALIRAITRCLEKDANARPADASALEREFLALARRLDPEHTLIVRPAEPTVLAPARDVTTSRRELLREAEEAIEQGDLTTASGLLQKLEASAPPGDVLPLRQKLQARRIGLRAQDAFGRADDAVHTGTIEDAELALAALVEIAPQHAEIGRLRHALQARVDARQLASLTSRARLALQQDRLEDAEALVAEALALAPDAADALAVQQALAGRSRAQRIARLVAQASRALDQDDVAGARRAIEAIVRIDPAHRDVARLQGRLQALTAEIDGPAGPDTPARPSPAPRGVGAAPRKEAAVAAATPAAGERAAAAGKAVGSPAAAPVPPRSPQPRQDAPRGTAPASAPAAGAAVAATPSRAAGAVPGPAGDVLLRPAAAPADPGVDGRRAAPRADAAATSSDTRRGPILAAAAALALLAVGGGAYYAIVVRPVSPSSGTPTVTSSRPTTAAEPPATASGPPLPAVTTTSAALTEPTETNPTAPAATPATGVAAGEATPGTSGRDPWLPIRQLTARGAFDRAMTAIDQVRGRPSSEAQAERTRIVETVRRNTLAARRGAEDLRLTRSPQYVLGTTRQAEADRERQAGRLKSAVAAYMDARVHFLQAFTDNGRTPGSNVVSAPAAEPPAASTTTTGPATAPAATESGAAAERRPSLSTWSNEEARATIASFCGAYLARDMGGLQRLWPNMGPEWRAELQQAFGTSGELVCVFENVTLVRTSDEFNASARLLTQLPGGEQRRRSLAMSLVPVGDRIVIGNIRVR